MPHNSPELVQASLKGDLEKVKELIAAGADVNSSDEHGMGPLLCFTPEVTEFLLSKGADPNRQKNESNSPVIVGVAYMNHPKCVRLLLEGGADANALVPDNEETPLHASLSRDPSTPEDERHAVVETLLKHGADPNRRTVAGSPTLAYWRDVRTRGETPLHRAAASAAELTIRLLLEAGADKTIRDANGDSPQSWASWHWRSKQIVDLLAPD